MLRIIEVFAILGLSIAQYSPVIPSPGLGLGDTGLKCPDLLPPLGGNITYSMEAVTFGLRLSGTNANLNCFGSSPTGVSSTTCQNGLWSPPIGACGPSTGLGLPGLPPITNTAPLPGAPVVPGLPAATGGIGGMGGVPGGIGGISLPCPALPQPFMNTGTISYSDGKNDAFSTHQQSVTASLTCSGGSTVSGSATATCANGVWSPFIGTCLPQSG